MVQTLFQAAPDLSGLSEVLGHWELPSLAWFRIRWWARLQGQRRLVRALYLQARELCS